jgi:hypothetical protein
MAYRRRVPGLIVVALIVALAPVSLAQGPSGRWVST